MVFVEPGDGAFEGEFAAGDLELLDEIGGATEQDAPAVLDQGEADGGGEMRLSPAGRAEQEIGALVEPAVAGAEGEDIQGLAVVDTRWTPRRKSKRSPRGGVLIML